MAGSPELYPENKVTVNLAGITFVNSGSRFLRRRFRSTLFLSFPPHRHHEITGERSMLTSQSFGGSRHRAGLLSDKIGRSLRCIKLAPPVFAIGNYL